jgi:hypothetical protein
MGFLVVLDRKRGSCISILVKEGRQKGPRVSLWIKGIARWDSKLKEIARRDLVFRYLKVARWDLGMTYWKKRGIARWDSKLTKGDRQKGSRVSLFGGRQMGPRITCWKKKEESPDGIPSWLKEIARRDLVFHYLEVARWDLGFHE